MGKKILIAIAVLILGMLAWAIFAGGEQDEELIKEEAYQVEDYEYEVEPVNTIITFDIDGEVYTSDIAISNSEILYVAQKTFNIPTKFDISYQLYSEGKHRYAGNINYEDGEYQSEGLETSDIQGDGNTYGVEGESEEGKKDAKETKEIEKRIIRLAKESFEKMTALNERKMITVNDNYYVKEVIVENQDTIKEIQILNIEQRTGDKTVIKITIEE